MSTPAVNGTSVGPGLSPPGPRGAIFFGNIFQARRDPLRFLTQCAREYGDVVRIRFFNQVAYLINHPDDIESILTTNSQNFIKPPSREPSRASENLFGEDLLASDGDFWTNHRMQAQPAFHRDRIASYGEVMVGHTQGMLGAWQDGEVRDVYDDMRYLTLEVVSKTLFNTDVTDQVEDLNAALGTIMHEITARVVSPLRLPASIPTPRNRRFRWAIGRLGEFLDKMIHEHRTTGQGEGDLLSILLQARDQSPGKVTDNQWRYEIMTLFIAGYETTALALSWSLYLLSQYPEVDARLAAELHAALGGRRPEAADYQRLFYTEMVVKESLRLYPPAWLLGGRVALEECEIGGFRMPAGAMIVISPWVTHRDPRNFENPELFKPERWVADRATALPKYAYYPFSGGSRHCIGYSYAMMESVLMLSTIAQRFKLSLIPGHPVSPQPLITLRPRHGLKMQVRRRN
jgi:cytochrome P450